MFRLQVSLSNSLLQTNMDRLLRARFRVAGRPIGRTKSSMLEYPSALTSKSPTLTEKPLFPIWWSPYLTRRELSLSTIAS